MNNSGVRWFIVYVVLLVCCALGITRAYAQNKDSLIHQLHIARHDTHKIYILRVVTDIADDGSIRPYFDTAITLCQKGITAGEKPQELYVSSLATIYSNMGRYYRHRSDYNNALDAYNKALDLGEKLKDKKFISTVLNNIAVIYDDLGDMKKSLEVSYQDLKIQEELKDTLGIAHSYNNLAHIFTQLKDSVNALAYYTRSLKMFNIINDAHGSAMIMANIGTYYSDHGDHAAALASYKKSLALYKQRNDTYFIGEVLACCGHALDKLGQSDSALQYFSQALVIARELDVKENMAYCYTAMAKIVLKKGNTLQAQQYATLSLDISRQLGGARDIQNSAKVLKDIYLQTGNYKEAYAMYSLEVAMRDSMTNEANYQQAINKKLQYDYDKKELELKLENEKKIIQKDIIMLSVTFIAAVVLLLAYFYTRQQKLKTKVERMELEQQQYRAQMNPHFIFNCLNSIQHYIVHNDVMSANKYLSEFATLMRTTLEHNKLHTIALHQEIEYLTSYLTLEQMRFENKFTYNIICAPGLNTFNIQMLPSIVQPFAENAIVHGLCWLDGAGILSINFQQAGDILICTIDDNGIGRKASQDMKKELGKPHRSHGMDLVRKRLALATSLNKKNYEIEIVDKINSDGSAGGTLVTLKFPIES